MGMYHRISYTDSVNGVRRHTKITHWTAGILIFLLLSSVTLYVFRSLHETNRLKTHNTGERAINDFLRSLRDLDSVGEIEDFIVGSKNILGVGNYSADGTQVIAFGNAPEQLTEEICAQPKTFPRTYIPVKDTESILIIQHAPGRPSRHPPPPEPARTEEKNREDMFRVPFRSEIILWDIHVPTYWSNRRLYMVLFPLVEILAAFGVWFVLRLIRKNAEYRARIEEQMNLVVLGTAAGILAHEIKNPLSSIRLQTDILERSHPGTVKRETEIILEEVDRLAMLSDHVNDYLRNPRGIPEPLNPVHLIEDVMKRIVGHTRLYKRKDENVLIYIDPQRFTSVMENLLLNAVESGSDVQDIVVTLGADRGKVTIEVHDGGRGITDEAAARLFDPFFTTKSRGTGIGLAVIRRFIEAAGGTITLVNRKEKGATAVIVLPEHPT